MTFVRIICGSILFCINLIPGDRGEYAHDDDASLTMGIEPVEIVICGRMDSLLPLLTFIVSNNASRTGPQEVVNSNNILRN